MVNSKKLFSQIDQSKNILLLCHRNPDADTLGSAGAFAFFIEKHADKQATIFCPEPIPRSLVFLGLEKFITNDSEIKLKNYDLIIALDCGDITQTGIPEKVLDIKNLIPLINIDHHQTNPNYGNLNIVQPMSATTEIVYRLFQNANIELTRQISTCLLTGIITDTTYYTNAGTTKDSMSTSSNLLKQGADIKKIIKNTWRNNSPEALKLWGKILSQLHFNSEHKIVSAVISKEDAIMPEVFEGMANFLTTLYEANIIIVIHEGKDDTIKCSLRTTKDNIDVAKLAQRFGGGGHAKAAGFSLTGRLEKTEKGWKVVQ
ncbi:bifunctional oligoribonuclease/PAP phosphatase NrnA [Candidatus Kuenenbacteria bacterium]|nr:bifunctional oligoribonuclease/PAP phosphatase NrnA [Candidatus Kuenenbacteria bacterium]